MILPYTMGDSEFYNSDMKGSILGINNNSSVDIITASYEAMGFSLKERLEYISNCGMNIDNIQLVCSGENEQFIQIISDIISKKIILRNEHDMRIKNIYNHIFKKNENENVESITINPTEDRHNKYNKLNGLYKSAYSSLNDVYRYRRKILKTIKK